MEENDIVVPASTGGRQQVYIRAQKINADGADNTYLAADDERELAGRPRTIQDALKGVNSLIEDLKNQFGSLNAERVAIEIGLEFAIESGDLIAIVAKASGKSSVKVTLEWGNAEAGN